MGTIITSGIGSGLDITSLVSQLVQAEGQATQVRLDVKEAEAQGKLSALGTLRSALAELKSAIEALRDIDDFRGRSVAASSDSYISASATTAAIPGSYSIEVERLAMAHRLASQALADQDTVVGTGTLTLTVGGQAFAVEIDDSNNTVVGIATAINEATSNTGVSATVINGVDGARLVLSATQTGASDSITVTQAGGDGGLDILVYDPGTLTNLTEIQAAQDARVLINSFAVEGSTNTISGAISGVDIALLATNAVGETTEITIDYDQSGGRKALETLVASYNKLADSVAKLASYDVETGTAGPLFGDAGLRNVVFQLRRELNDSVGGLSGPFSIIQQVGIETGLDGKLSIDAERLDAAFAQDFDAVGELFADENDGLAVRLDTLLEAYLKTDGILDARNDSVAAEIDDITEQRDRLAVRLGSLEQRLFRQFNALDTLLAQLQSTSNFLAQQLNNLPGSDVLLRGQGK